MVAFFPVSCWILDRSLSHVKQTKYWLWSHNIVHKWGVAWFTLHYTTDMSARRIRIEKHARNWKSCSLLKCKYLLYLPKPCLKISSPYSIEHAEGSVNYHVLHLDGVSFKHWVILLMFQEWIPSPRNLHESMSCIFTAADNELFLEQKILDDGSQISQRESGSFYWLVCCIGWDRNSNSVASNERKTAFQPRPDFSVTR